MGKQQAGRTWGRKPRAVPKSGPQKVADRTRKAMRQAGAQSRKAVAQLREKLPSGEAIKERAGKARTWAADQVGEHAVALGLTTLAAGVAGAALLPVSDRERRALTKVKGKVQELSRTVGASPQVARVTRSLNDVVARAKGGLGGTAAKARAAPKATAKKAGGAKKRAASAGSAGKKTAGRPAAAAKRARPAVKKKGAPSARK